MQNSATNKISTGSATNPGYESSEPGTGWILFAAAVVVMMACVCMLTVRSTLAAWSGKRPQARDVHELGVLTAPGNQLLQRFPAPQLQLAPNQDLQALRANEEEELTTYGWMDRSNGVVRIPIQRAMNLLAERGLSANPANSHGAPGKSSLDLIRERSDKR